MSGLRERQKQERRQLIAEAALRVFTANGYMATTLEQIGTEAGVSAPTVTNYFGGKQEILVALLRAPDEKAIQESREYLLTHDDPIEALCELERRIAHNQLDAMPASLWSELAPFWLSGGLSDVFQSWNDTILEEARHTFRHFQERKIFRADLDLDLTARLFNDYLNLAFLRLATKQQPDLAKHSAHVRGVIKLLCNGLMV